MIEDMETAAGTPHDHPERTYEKSSEIPKIGRVTFGPAVPNELETG